MARKKQRRPVPEPKPEARPFPVKQLLERYSVAAVLLLLILASVRIATTYTVFNHTIDEPAHIACGLEWLDKGVYKYETQHPPLARVAAALGPYLHGVRTMDKEGMYYEGAAILYIHNHYDLHVILARLGTLPFFWLASVAVFLWARRHFDNVVALFAVLLFTFLPAILAHSGFATTDMALTAFLTACFFTFALWMESPALGRSLLFGLCLGLAVLSKFSAVVFLPAVAGICGAAYLLMNRAALRELPGELKRRILPACMVLVVGAVTIWAGYRFSFGEVPHLGLSLPAPELFLGIDTVIRHNEKGHASYLLGETSNIGFLHYYPVALAVKTPLPFLALAAIGVYLLWQRRRDGSAFWLPLAFAAGILLVGLLSRINIGVRHILPMYAALAIVAAVGASHLLSAASRKAAARYTLGALLLWFLAGSALSHPDYLAYFNLLAGSKPEEILVDSDLDWGQDMKRLAKRLQEVGAREVAFSPLIIAHLEAVHGFPPIKPSHPIDPSPGWNAVGATVWKAARMGLNREHPDLTPWPDRVQPRERVGKSIFLYYFPPRAPAGR